jgi:hypothetical protein
MSLAAAIASSRCAYAGPLAALGSADLVAGGFLLVLGVASAALQTAQQVKKAAKR